MVAGIWPLVSLRNAEFMKNEVPGVFVPDEVVSQDVALRQQGGGHGGRALPLPASCWMRCGESIAGVQISAPMGKVQSALSVVGNNGARRISHPNSREYY